MSQPDRHNPTIKIEDVVDIKLMQELQDTFARAMGVAAVTVNEKGVPITATSNFCDVCNMIRSTEAGLERCQQCDAEGGQIAHKRGEPYAYKCAGGLMDAAAPIIVDGQYIGSILCGQAIPEESYEEFVQDILARNIPLGLPAEQFEETVRKMKPVRQDRFFAAVEMLSLTANNIIENSAANLAQKRLLNEAQERAALQAALKETELKALKAQINPHFLFNSLTLLGYTALDEDAPRTEEIVYTLSDLLRYSLRNLASSVGLIEEIEMIKQYLAIQKIRFGERLVSDIDLDPDLADIEIPCMILQPLVENAVIHGAEPLSRPVTIGVKVQQDGEMLLLEVRDDGVGMPPELVTMLNAGMFDSESKSIGLQNVFQRLRSEYSDQFTLTVESAPGAGTHFSLTIPLRPEASPPLEEPATAPAKVGNQSSRYSAPPNFIPIGAVSLEKDRISYRNGSLLTPLQ